MKIVIGDIHACSFELEELLERIGPGHGDSIIALGDIFDRGPDNRRILELFKGDARFLSLKGNHERKHLLINRGECRAAISQEITKAELGSDYSMMLDYIRELPLYVELDNAILVHGSIEPGIPLSGQEETVLAGSLSGEKHLHYLGKPWYEALHPEKPVIFGHVGYDKPFIFNDMIYGIDTRCCRGGSLTAITLPDFTFHSVKARRNYWAENKKTFRREKSSRAKELLPGSTIMDSKTAYETIMKLTALLKKNTDSRRKFALAVQRWGLPPIFYKAYDERLEKEDLLTVDASVYTIISAIRQELEYEWE
ncbi:MAG: metallophosphoesterase [Candidatus Xenobiia bacterium LiM19]